MTPLRIAIVGPTIEGGGVNSYLRRQAEELRAVGHKVDIIDDVAIESRNPLVYGRLVDGIPGSADIVHVHFEAGLFGRLLVSGIGGPWLFHRLNGVDQPVITTLHEVHAAHSHRGGVGDRLLRWRDWLLERAALRASDAVIVPSQGASDVLRRRHGDRTRVAIRPHPVETDVERVDSEVAKEEFDLTGDVLLTFGWVEEKKRYSDVVDALPDVPTATYLIAGGKKPGEGEVVLESVFNRASALGVRDRVRYLGYVEEDRIDTLVSAADIVVLPYDRVSQSGAINDALAHGKPVITTSLPFFEELRERYGCLLCYENPTYLGTLLQSVLTNETSRQQLATEATAYVRENSWSRFAEWMETLYADYH